MKWVIASFLSIVCSCAVKNDIDVKSKKLVNVSSISVPASAAVSEPVQIKASAEANNACWHDFHFTVERSGDFTYAIKAYAAFESKGMCAQVMVGKDTTITFIPDKKGTYIFKTNESPFEVSTDTLTVN